MRVMVLVLACLSLAACWDEPSDAAKREADAAHRDFMKDSGKYTPEPVNPFPKSK